MSWHGRCVVNKQLYGWYSEQQRKFTGVLEYEGADGEPVHVTQVNDSATEHRTGWDDIASVGPVGRFLRTVENHPDRGAA